MLEARRKTLPRGAVDNAECYRPAFHLFKEVSGFARRQGFSIVFSRGRMGSFSGMLRDS